jgi:hypothetical protein
MSQFLWGKLANHAEIAHTESTMISPHLAAERDRLLDAIAQIRQAGPIAPAYCWLSTTSTTKKGKTYTYATLVEEKPHCKPKVISLGKLGSVRHRSWQIAIANREAITELEQQLSILQKLIDRQATQ